MKYKDDNHNTTTTTTTTTTTLLTISTTQVPYTEERAYQLLGLCDPHASGRLTFMQARRLFLEIAVRDSEISLSESLQMTCIEAGIMPPADLTGSDGSSCANGEVQTSFTGALDDSVGALTISLTNSTELTSSSNLNNLNNDGRDSSFGIDVAHLFKCVLCSEPIAADGTRYHCLQCYATEVCQQCHDKLNEPLYAQYQSITSEARAFYYYPAFRRSLWHAHTNEHYIRRIKPSLSLPEKRGGPAFRVDTVYQTLENAMRYYGDARFVGVRVDFSATTTDNAESQFQWFSFRHMLRRIEHFASGLQQYFAARTFVAICSINRPEWLVADLACSRQDYPSVPININQDCAGLQHILHTTQTQCVIVSADLIANFCDAIKSAAATDKPTYVRMIVSIDQQIKSSVAAAVSDLGIELMRFSEIEQLGSKNVTAPAIAKPNDLYTLTYTSGSTGTPKGVMFSNSAFNNRICTQYGMPFPLCTVSFCSMAHFMVCTQRQPCMHLRALTMYGHRSYLCVCRIVK
jgi:hypothetical protein